VVDEKLTRLEDNYVTGKIDRATFESQRAALLGNSTNRTPDRTESKPPAHASPRA
jgi:hypothetical protein